MMNRSEDRGIPVIYGNGPVATRPASSYRLTRKDQGNSLLELAEQLQGILVPVAPSADYRRRLHGELLLEAQRQRAEPAAPSLFRQHRTGILLGAAAVGSVASVVVGVVVAFLFRLRHGRATHTATG